MNNNKTDNRIYILQKQLPNLGVGAQFQSNGKGEYHCYSQYVGENECYSIAHFPAKDVEENFDWFKLKEQEEEKSKRIEVTDMMNTGGCNYAFCVSEQFQGSKFDSVKKAIERALNHEITLDEVVQDYLQKDIPTLDRQHGDFRKSIDNNLKNKWEAEDNKDWEIQSYRNKERNTFFKRDQWGDYDFSLIREKYGDKVEINSVLRKSDGCIFSIGDKIRWGTFNYETTITGFEIINNAMFVCFNMLVKSIPLCWNYKIEKINNQ